MTTPMSLHPDHNKFSSLSHTTVVAVFLNVCLWRRSLCSNLGSIDPEKLYRATLIRDNAALANTRQCSTCYGRDGTITSRSINRENNIEALVIFKKIQFALGSPNRYEFYSGAKKK